MDNSVDTNTSSAPSLLFFPYCSAKTTGSEPAGMASTSVITVVTTGGREQAMQTAKVTTGHSRRRRAEYAI